MLLRPSQMFRRVTIIGVGLMGGSLGMAIKKHKLAQEVVGVSLQQSTLVQAIKLQAIDEAQTELDKALRNADLVVLATPVETINKLFALINPHVRRGCIITDMGSTKAEVVEAADKNLSNAPFFVGSHPLVGSEQHGVEHARAELFENAQCIMTPTDKTNTVAKEKIKFLWTKLGARVTFLSPEEHDQILAYTSHLPHLAAYALMETIPAQHISYASQGLKDTTRIAASSPRLWNDICLANTKNILKGLDEMVKNLSVLRKAIINRDEQTIISHFSKAKEKRDGLSANQ